jgi:hypothetical protein
MSYEKRMPTCEDKLELNQDNVSRRRMKRFLYFWILVYIIKLALDVIKQTGRVLKIIFPQPFNIQTFS